MEFNSRGMYEPSPSKAVNDLPHGSRNVYDTPKHTRCEPKIDGVRVLLHFLPDGRVEATSRRRDQSGFYSRLTENLPQLQITNPFTDYTILDGELVMPQLVGSSTGTLGSIMSIVGSLPDRAIALQEKHGFAKLIVFDCLVMLGRDVRSNSLTERQDLVKLAVEALSSSHIEMVLSEECRTESEKREFVNRCWEAGFEGAVFKDPGSGYYDKRAWLKVKQEETLDVIVHGFKPGLGKYKDTLGALKGSVIDERTGELVSVCAAMPGDDRQRDELYEQVKGLTKEETLALNIIVEVEFQGWTKDNRLRHPRTRRYRPDRSEPNTVNFSEVKKI